MIPPTCFRKLHTARRIEPAVMGFETIAQPAINVTTACLALRGRNWSGARQACADRFEAQRETVFYDSLDLIPSSWGMTPGSVALDLTAWSLLTGIARRRRTGCLYVQRDSPSCAISCAWFDRTRTLGSSRCTFLVFRLFVGCASVRCLCPTQPGWAARNQAGIALLPLASATTPFEQSE